MQLHFACGSGPFPTGKRKREDFTFHLQGVPGSAAPEGAGKGVPQGGKRDSADKRCLSGGSARIQMQPGRNTSRNSSRNSSGLCEPPLPSERALQPSPVTQQAGGSQALAKAAAGIRALAAPAQDRDWFLRSPAPERGSQLPERVGEQKQSDLDF